MRAQREENESSKFSSQIAIGLLFVALCGLGMFLGVFNEFPGRSSSDSVERVFEKPSDALLETSPPKPFGFRVMSFNVRRNFESDGVNQWKYRVPLVAEMLKKEAPHIIGMQEVLPEQIEQIKNMLPNHEMIGVGREDGKADGEFVPVFYDKQMFVPVKTGFFWLSQTPEIPGSIYRGAGCTRVTSWALLTSPHSEHKCDVLFLSTHLDHVSEHARDLAAQVLRLKIREILDKHASKLRGTAVVLVGDFNAEPQEAAFRTLLNDKWTPTNNFFHDSRLSSASAKGGREIGTFPSWNSLSNGKVIDYVLYTPVPLACFKGPGKLTKEAAMMGSREALECLRYTLRRGAAVDFIAKQYRVAIDPVLQGKPTQPSDHRPVVVDFEIDSNKPVA
eukprot:CAMPEP_0167763380 /NCGR_PEP_ID=MMETSP0110_2-20121227/13333_1 /TAXON_ID=629695 /ORGANISM="Gymnochlora sp., Strain CCMP2014" /LENGTH=389 /DNA_ID=CAMNT_0007650443 /DNA_START=46 /DNA_END=1212 /DNA_ORIENTATION=+